MKRRELIDVAMGHVPADLIIRGGKLVNVHTGEIYPADVAVKSDRIAAVGEVSYTAGPETQVVDAAGGYLVPGLIETHQHVAGSHLCMTEFARAVLPHGTTCIATDFYEIAVVGGVPAVRSCLDELARTPLKVFFVIPVPAFYQNSPFGHTGSLSFEDMKSMLDWAECYGLNEAFAPRVLAKDREMLELIRLAREKGKVIVGHASEISGRELQAWAAYVGLTTDHECVSAEEAVEKARLGVRVLLREGSAASDLLRVARAITEYGVSPRMFAFCTDEEDPLRLARVGHLDHKVRLAISAGINPVTAVQMATLNAAECYGVSHEVGSLAPGKLADVLVVKNLREFSVDLVIANGRVVAQQGSFTADLERPRYSGFMYNTVRLQHPVLPEDLRIRAPAGKREATVRAIVATEGDLITTEKEFTLRPAGGYLEADVEQDVLKIAVLERHRRTGKIGKGFIHGFGLTAGAIASTFNPHNEDLVVVGANDEDMALAANRVADSGGGFVAVRAGQVLAELPLPLFGLLSNEPLEVVIAKLEQLYQVIREMGCPFRGPFTTLGFMCLPVIIGKLKICCDGLVRVWEGRLVDVVVN